MAVQIPESPAPAPHQKQDDKRLTDDDFKSLIETLQPHEELEKLRQIEVSIRDAQQRRQRENEEMKAKIQGMETALLELKRNSTRSAAEWRSLNSHREVMAKLDNQKFDLAKSINEEESKLSALQSELSELKKEYEEVDACDVENEYDMDRDALSLKIFRAMGFLPSKDADSSADDPISSILVRSDKRNAALPFEVSDDVIKQLGISPFILAEQLWKAAE